MTATCTLDSQLGCAVECPSPSKVPLPHRWSSSASSSEELLPAQACTSPPAEARLEPFPEPPQVSFMERWQDAGLAGTPRKLRRTSDDAAFSPWADASQDTGGDLEDESLEVPEKDPCYESPLPRGWTPPDSPLIGPKTPKTQAIADELDAGLASFLGPSNVRQDLPSSSSAADLGRPAQGVPGEPRVPDAAPEGLPQVSRVLCVGQKGRSRGARLLRHGGLGEEASGHKLCHRAMVRALRASTPP